MTGEDSHDSYSLWRVWIPPIALLTIALAQVMLATTADLCPWKGGGFGMFSTNDAAVFRHVRVFVQREASFEELEIERSEEVNAIQASLFPSDRLLTRLAQAFASREQSAERSVNAVRVE